jgi:hypothetical protein
MQLNPYAGAWKFTRNTGHFVNVLNAQAEGLFRSFSNYKSFLSGVIQAAAYVGFAVLLSWQMALALLVFGVLLLSLFSALNNYVRQLSQKRGQYPFLKPKRVLPPFFPSDSHRPHRHPKAPPTPL